MDADGQGDDEEEAGSDDGDEYGDSSVRCEFHLHSEQRVHHTMACNSLK